ncbi:hypothetical protein ACLOJK_014588 [Asimina triloba]
MLFTLDRSLLVALCLFDYAAYAPLFIVVRYHWHRAVCCWMDFGWTTLPLGSVGDEDARPLMRGGVGRIWELLLEKMCGDGFRSPVADLLCDGWAFTVDWRRWALADLAIDLGIQMKMDSPNFSAVLRCGSRIWKGCHRPLLLLVVDTGKDEERCAAAAGWPEKMMTPLDLLDLPWSETREKMGCELVAAITEDGEDDVRSRRNGTRCLAAVLLDDSD